MPTARRRNNEKPQRFVSTGRRFCGGSQDKSTLHIISTGAANAGGNLEKPKTKGTRRGWYPKLTLNYNCNYTSGRIVCSLAGFSMS